ncbi:MAG: hypothetical protein IJ875_04275, partial [Solobacterium sp.]|nr:hypothetical protein [Solobacterium sp.]
VGFKKLFFEGLSNSYSNQITLDVILNPYGFAYMMYAAIYYIAAILVSLFIIPWLRVLSLYREYSKPIKNLIIFISMVLLISVGTIAFTISVREDLGRIAPRLHMRYLMPFILIYLLLYFVSMDGLNTKAFGSNRRKMFLFIALAFCALVFKGTTLGSSVDQYSFMWTIKLETILSGLTIPILGKNVPLYLIFIVGLIMGIALVLSIFEKNARTKNEIIFFSVLLLVMNIGNTILAYDEFKPAYQFDKWDVEEVIQLSTYIDEDGDDARVLMILENGLSAKAQVLDTFFDTEGEEIYITGAFARDYENEEQVSTIPFEEAIWGEQYPLVNEIEYVIIEKNIFDHEYTLENMDVINQVGGRNFVLVKNQDNLTFGVDCK